MMLNTAIMSFPLLPKVYNQLSWFFRDNRFDADYTSGFLLVILAMSNVSEIPQMDFPLFLSSRMACPPPPH